MVAEGPARYHRHCPGKFCQSADYGLRGFPVYDEYPEGNAFAFQIYLFVSTAQDGFSCSVEQDSECGAVSAYSHHPRVRLIEARPVIYAVGAGVSIPEFYGCPVSSGSPSMANEGIFSAS